MSHKSRFFLQSLKAPLIMSIPALLIFGIAGGAEFGSRYTLCKLGKEVRTLRIEKIDGGKCRTSYTKLGKDQNVAEAQNEGSCEEVLGRVRTTLESAGWKCREVKDSSVSDLNQVIQ